MNVPNYVTFVNIVFKAIFSDYVTINIYVSYLHTQPLSIKKGRLFWKLQN